MSVSAQAQAASQLYFRKGTLLTIFVYNLIAGQVTGFEFWYVNDLGKLKQQQIPSYTSAHSNASKDQAFQVTLPENGQVVSFSAKVIQTTNATQVGQTLVVAVLDMQNTSVSTSTSDSYVLVCGYVFSGISGMLQYPSSKAIQNPTDGPGSINVGTTTAQDNGTGINLSVPTNQRWHMRSIDVHVQASSTAGNRTPYLSISNGSVTFFNSPSAPAIVANGLDDVEWIIGYPVAMAATYDANSLTAVGNMMDMIFNSNALGEWTVQLIGHKAGDNTNLIYEYDGWIDPAS